MDRTSPRIASFDMVSAPSSAASSATVSLMSRRKKYADSASAAKNAVTARHCWRLCSATEFSTSRADCACTDCQSTADRQALSCDVAAACRLISRLNGHVTHEGSFAHISVPLPGTETSDEPLFLVTPSDVPFAAMRASLLVVCDARGAVVRGTGYVDGETFRAFHRIRDAGTPGRYGAVLFSHTEFTDRLAAHGRRIRMVSQSAFNFAFDYFGYFDAWGHSLIEACEDADGDKFRENLVDYVAEDDKVFVMLSHGGCLARGDDVAHVFSLLHGIDAAAEIQVYAEMTGFPVMELDKDEVKTFPTHGYGDFRSKSKRMGLNFDANKRLLLCDFNHGFRDTGDSAFVL